MATPRTTRLLPSPTPLSQPFWAGTRAHKLLLQRCGQCGAFRWTPQYACPGCLSEGYEWVESGGRGSLYSFTVVERSPDPEAFGTDAYVVAIVALDEGPYMLTDLVQASPDSLRLDMPVEVAFEDASDEITLYHFRPSAA